MSEFFKVTQWDAKALFSLSYHADTCAICRTSLQELCLECQGLDVETQCSVYKRYISF